MPDRISAAEVLNWKWSNQSPVICTRENTDGSVTIFNWPPALGPVPTLAQIAQWEAEYVVVKPDLDAASNLDRDRFTRFLFEVFFVIDNRVRALEAKPSLTKPQFRDALVAAYKALP